MKKIFLAIAATALLSSVAQAATYQIEPTHTFATFEMSHFGASVNRGRFDKKEGVVEFDAAAKKGRVDVTFETASINTGTPQFDSHIKSAEILDVQKYPKAQFVGDKFIFNGDKVTEVSGMFTLHGKTLPLTLKAKQFNCFQHPMLKREVCGGDFEATLKRSQWDVGYGISYGFQDDIRLVIQVEAVKQ